MAAAVHSCCGCSCRICRKGHNMGMGEHSEPCRSRFYAEWLRANPQVSDGPDE